ncbi:hypothetical protein GH714_033219 [Hevea brasiliensis]|uniref:non-specific serine/threonine protein kinase n=1 Tax=Hevea brasiliensis TaxID=3981 RepID=A0A6A6L2M6_HEVBR|nr:hypothetical protein GH714_033219 [Hevea brasiliensis]
MNSYCDDSALIPSKCSTHDCGNGVAIEYPFWYMDVNSSDEVCGYPEFGLSCSGDEPILKLPNNTYYVNSINYANSTITLVDIDVTGQTCPRARHNLTLENLPLGYTNLDLNLSFYFNCSSSPFSFSASAIGCLEFSTNQSYVSMTENQTNDVDWIGKCEEKLVATVMRTEITTNGLISEFGGAMNKGFMLDWRTVKGCGSCEDSGGFCGYNKTAEESKCFCRDGTVHSSQCKGDQDFTECLKPFHCGLLSNLSYPFWDDSRSEICGFQGLKLRCQEGKRPVISINNEEFYVQSVDQPQHVMTIALWENVCPLDNVSQFPDTSLNETPFSYVPEFENITLFYNCTNQITMIPDAYRISCGENGPRNAFYATDDAPFRGQDLPDCNTSVKAPVPSRELIRGLENLTRVLMEGFNVTYKFNHSCGTDPSPTLFECLCREKPDRAGCPKGTTNIILPSKNVVFFLVMGY